MNETVLLDQSVLTGGSSVFKNIPDPIPPNTEILQDSLLSQLFDSDNDPLYSLLI